VSLEIFFDVFLESEEKSTFVRFQEKIEEKRFAEDITKKN
jgi:hypothetical protein